MPRARVTHLALVIFAGTAMVLAAPALAKVFSSGNLSTKIPQIGLAKSKIEVTKRGDVTDVDVSVRLSHTYTCDLIVGVQGPKGNDGFIELSNEHCDDNDEDDLGAGNKSCSGDPTVFDDEAATAIGAGTNPFSGSFTPDEPLDEFDNDRARGTWKLFVFDINQGDKGTLHCWKLDVDTA